MLRNIAIGLGVLIALIIGGAFLLPQNVRVERSVVMAAAPEDVFGIVNDMTRFNEWSPWAKLDPKAEYKYDGPPTGVGAKLAWNSKDANVGSGSQEIVESTPFTRIKTKLDFGAEGTAFAVFSFEAVEGGTKVSWGFETDLGMNPVSRYFGLMFDSWIGKDYELGLANLKKIVEASARAALQDALSAPGSELPAGLDSMTEADPAKGPAIVDVSAKPVLLLRAQSNAADDSAISTALGAANTKLLGFAETNGLEISGAALAITVSHANGIWTFDAALPLVSKPAAGIAEADGVKIGETYAGRALKLTHKGPYSTLKASYDRLHAFAKENGLKEKGVSWEEYVGDPSVSMDDEVLTNIYIAVE